jgi:choline-sulfatase
MGKQNLYDHSLRVPFIVVGPGVPADRVSDEPIYYQDVMPTTLELAGVKPPDHVSFQSLVPLIRGAGQSKYPSIYNAYMHLQRCLTQDGWKLLLYPQIKHVRLYHVAEDPHERYDRADDAGQAARIKRLFNELVRWQKETGDEFDLSKAYPELL